MSGRLNLPALNASTPPEREQAEPNAILKADRRGRQALDSIHYEVQNVAYVWEVTPPASVLVQEMAALDK
jgi:hypothetical protein